MSCAVYWTSPKPFRCDCCGAPIGTRFYDAVVGVGWPGATRWGILDEKCWIRHNGRLGVGVGQRYDLQDDGRYMKTGG
jgi:hypothetical protein